MKKLLCVLLFGMVFGIDVYNLKNIRINDIFLLPGINPLTLDELLPEYNLEWATISIVGFDYSQVPGGVVSNSASVALIDNCNSSDINKFS